MESHADALAGITSALDRLGPAQAHARLDPQRRAGLRTRLGRLGEIGLRPRIAARGAASAR